MGVYGKPYLHYSTATRLVVARFDYYCYYYSTPRRRRTIVHIAHPGSVGNLVLRHCRYRHVAHRDRELPDGSVILRPAEQTVTTVPHLELEQALPRLTLDLVLFEEAAAAELLAVEGLSPVFGVGFDGTVDGVGELCAGGGWVGESGCGMVRWMGGWVGEGEVDG